MNTLDIVFIFICLGILASLIIQIIKIELLVSDINNIRIKLDVIDEKTDKNKEHTDLRIARIIRIMDSNVSGYERYGEAIKQNTDKINILVERVNKVIKGAK
jgi:hypothetical protein|tara:strand:+ start:230 stop:535 length:306 start_codon:yes stop_codon:yes gene_type:complete